MSLIWREAVRDDVPGIVQLLADDVLGKARETGDDAAYFQAFDAMQAEGGNLLIVGAEAGTLVATYQLTFISGLSLRAAKRAQIESVRVAATRRGAGIGTMLMEDAEARARQAGCALIQLTTNQSRTRAHAFYRRHGFTASHIGYKRDLT